MYDVNWHKQVGDQGHGGFNISCCSAWSWFCSGLKHTNLLSYSSVVQKSDTGLIRLKLRYHHKSCEKEESIVKYLNVERKKKKPINLKFCIQWSHYSKWRRNNDFLWKTKTENLLPMDTPCKKCWKTLFREKENDIDQKQVYVKWKPYKRNKRG